MEGEAAIISPTDWSKAACNASRHENRVLFTCATFPGYRFTRDYELLFRSMSTCLEDCLTPKSFSEIGPSLHISKELESGRRRVVMDGGWLMLRVFLQPSVSFIEFVS